MYRKELVQWTSSIKLIIRWKQQWTNIVTAAFLVVSNFSSLSFILSLINIQNWPKHCFNFESNQVNSWSSFNSRAWKLNDETFTFEFHLHFCKKWNPLLLAFNISFLLFNFQFHFPFLFFFYFSLPIFQKKKIIIISLWAEPSIYSKVESCKQIIESWKRNLKVKKN